MSPSSHFVLIAIHFLAFSNNCLNQAAWSTGRWEATPDDEVVCHLLNVFTYSIVSQQLHWKNLNTFQLLLVSDSWTITAKMTTLQKIADIEAEVRFVEFTDCRFSFTNMSIICSLHGCNMECCFHRWQGPRKTRQLWVTWVYWKQGWPNFDKSW